MLDVRNLSVAINGSMLVTGVDFSVATGGCLGLVGETGSGKSLTCRALTGMLPRIGGEVTEGSIRLHDLDLTTLGSKEWQARRGRDIAYIPQNSMSGLDPLMRVGRQLAETIRAVTPGVEARGRALELLDQVRMPNAHQVYDLYPHELSGGMKQRVMIALAIAGRPRLLVADEPTTALDVTVQKEILTLLSALRRELQVTVVFVTHDLGVVAEISDSVAVMYAGSTVEFGPTDRILSEPDHPYTSALLRAHPAHATDDRRLAAIQGAPPEPRSWPAGCRFAPRCDYRVAACELAAPPLTVLDSERWSRCIHPKPCS
jgi:oligopeptide/dipeptide ABC transporter ATP-binding protein